MGRLDAREHKASDQKGSGLKEVKHALTKRRKRVWMSKAKESGLERQRQAEIEPKPQVEAELHVTCILSA